MARPTVRLSVAGALVAMAVFAFAALAAGAPWLGAALPGGLPSGNALAALGLSAPAGAALILAARGSVLRRAATAVLVGAVAWLPVSVALAGNLALNFEGARGPLWLAGTLVVLAAAIGTLLWALAATALGMLRGTALTGRGVAADERVRRAR